MAAVGAGKECREGGADEEAWVVRKLGKTVAAAMLVAAVIAPSARAGTWTLVSCTQPGGQPAPTDGWTATAIGTLGANSGTANTCSQGGVLAGADSSLAPQDAYSGPVWQFTAPAGSTIAGGSMSLSLYAPQGQAYVATPNNQYDAADVIANCQFNEPCGSGGVYTATVPISHPGGTNIYAVAQCVPASYGAAVCPAGDGANNVNASFSIQAADISLTNSSTPQASGFGGGVLANPVRGRQDLTFSASDPNGPGVWVVRATLDSQVIYNATPDTNAGRCASIGQAADGSPEFLYEQPCKPNVQVDIPIDTTKLADGAHALRVSVEDAAGNTSTVYATTIQSQNTPSPSGLTGAVGQGGLLAGYNPAVHIPNGTGACEKAHAGLRFGSSAIVSVRLGRAATLHGELDCAGRPIAGGLVELTVAPAAGHSPQPVSGQLRTAADGTFSYALPPGPSRRIEVDYRAFSDDPLFAATATATLQVRPSISLRITPTHTRNGHSITYRGRVFGGYIPARGLSLDVQYRDVNRWRTFDQVTARARDGKFVYHYKFRRTTQSVIYTFRVAVPATGATGYPYQPAVSRARSVRVDP